jgi:hypothetical protein
VAGTGVYLDSVVIRFQEGASPDKIVHSFPTLKLSQVYGVIAYYLENEKIINDYIVEGDQELGKAAIPLSQTNPELFARRGRSPTDGLQAIVSVRFFDRRREVTLCQKYIAVAVAWTCTKRR